MRKIITHLWYDKEAKEAAAFYVDTFRNGSAIAGIETIDGTPSGTVDIVTFELLGRGFQAISAGPLFRPNPSVSFHVACGTKEEVEALWGKLSAGGRTLMELGAYPWSPTYGWCQDKYGVSWQVAQVDGTARPRLTPFVMFVGPVCGKAEEAARFWTSLFPDSAVGPLRRHGPGAAPDKEGTVLHGSFTLMGEEFFVMDSAHPHAFAFNEAISFIVPCETQAEIDGLWERLSAEPAAEQCGWLKDKFGLSWQVVPTVLGELMAKGDPAQRARVTQAFLKMKKFDVGELERASRG